jgi:hypothetical protein
MPNRALALLCLMLVLAVDAGAWGLKGHRMVASLAEKRLKSKHPQAWSKISGLLGPGITLASVALCADSVREYVRQPADARLPANCVLTNEEAKSRFSDSARWHYINIPAAAPSRSDAVLNQACPPDKPCAVTQIELFRKQLGNKKLANRDRLIALIFLTHLVADLHQPLHAVQRNKDAGGNEVIVKLGSQTAKLHSLWDTQLVEPIQEVELGGTVKAGNKTPKSWAWESYDAAVNVAYSEVPLRPSTFQNPIVIPEPHYRGVATDTIKQRLYAASVRLADLLAAAVGD